MTIARKQIAAAAADSESAEARADAVEYREAGKRWALPRFRVAALAVLLALLFAACSEDPKAKKLRFMSSGEKYLKAGKYQEAALQFRNAVQLDPKAADAHYQLALAYLNLNNPDGAFKQLTETVALQPTNWDAQLNLANLHIARREFDAATACVEKVLKANPDNAMAHATIALKYAVMRDAANATQSYEKAIKLAPQRVDFYIALATNVYLASGKPAEAEGVLKRATGANPKSLDAQMALARLYLTQRRPEGEAAAQAAIALDSKALAPRFMLARVYMAMGRPAYAEKVYRDLKSVAPDNPQAYQALGGFYEGTGERQKAIAEFKSVLVSKPKDILLKQRLIENLIAGEQLKEAEALNQEVLKAEKENALAHFTQGRLLLVQDRKQDAAMALQKASVLAPNNAQVHYLLGTTQASLGSVAQARESLTRALKIQPRMTSASVALAGLAVTGGDRETALRLTEKALELDPRSLPAQVARAQALLVSGDVRQSEAMLLEVLKREPAAVHALTVLASIKIGQGKSQEYLKRIAPLVQEQPNNAGLRYLLALAYHVSGDGQRAELEAKEALRLNSKIPRIHLLLASIYFTAGKPEPAKAVLRAAIDSDPRNVGTYMVLAAQYEKERNWGEARKLYEKARQLDPDSPVLANQLAYIYLEHGGDVNVALGLAQQAKQKLPDSPNVADTLGWAYYKQGLPAQAVPHLKRCVDVTPGDSTCQYHLGMAYIAAKNPGAAGKHLELALKDPALPSADSARQALAQISKGTR